MRHGIQYTRGGIQPKPGYSRTDEDISQYATQKSNLVKACWETDFVSSKGENYDWTKYPDDPGQYEHIIGKSYYSPRTGRTGGPDNFGYKFVDSYNAGGPIYGWKEISGNGTEVLPNSDDAWVGNINVGFFFNYYGIDYSQLAIGNNGLLFSGTGTSEFVNQPITQTPEIHGFIAPYWDDLVTWKSEGAGSIYYQTSGTAPDRIFIVEWYNNKHYHNSDKGITFEAILYEGSNNILFQYESVDFGNVYGAISADFPPYNNGGSATVGIEDPTGNIGLQYSYNEQAIFPGLVILLKFPAFAGTNMYLSMNAPASMDHGNMMTYSLYYNDFGSVAASNVVLKATLSSNVDFVSASDGGTYDSATRNVTWNIGTVPAFPSGRGLRTVTVTIPSSVPVGTIIQTAASIRTTTLETRYDDNGASAQTKVTGSNLPPNVGVRPTLGNPGGTTIVNWGTPITITYYDPIAISVDIRIHFDNGGAVIIGSMTGGPPMWTYTTTFYPRHGLATITITVHYPVGPPPPPPVNFDIYVDPAGYIYDANTLQRISGATILLQRPDGQGGWENVPTGQTPPLMQPDTNPQITGTDGQYQWDVLDGTYRVHVEAPGYYPADSIVVNVPPPVTDLNVGLTPLPVMQYQITFDQTGVGSDFTGTIVIIEGANYTVNDLPAVFFWDQGSVHNFSYASPLGVSTGKRYAWNSTTGLSTAQGGTLNIMGPGNVTANYTAQYEVTFDQSGVGSDFTATVVTIDGSNCNVSDLSASFWWDNSSIHGFAFQSPLVVGSGAKQYDWASTAGLSTLQSDSIAVTGPGSVTGSYVTLVHDVAVTDIVAVVPHCSNKAGNNLWVFQGRPVYINVTVSNKGDLDENVNITFYYNATANEMVGTQIVALSARMNQTIDFTWNTKGVPYCLNYTITAVASIPLDYDPADNTLGCGPITVRIMGDINGDGKVDGKDIVAVAMSFPSWGPDFLCPGSPSGPRWNLDCDINCDNRIDGKDLVLVALNFGK